MQLKLIDWKQNLAEIPQQLNTRFAFAHMEGDGVYSNTMPFVKCRDFFGDVLEAVQTGTTQGIYGFRFDPTQQPFDTDKCRLLIQFVSEESKQAFIKNHKTFKKSLRLLTNNISYGTIHNIKAEQPTVLVVANPIWQHSVIGISWFTYVLKVLSYPQLDATKSFKKACLNLDNSNEKAYMSAVKDTLEVFLQNYKKLTKNLQYVHGYNTPQQIYVVHNSAGFKSVLWSYLGDVGKQLKELMHHETMAK